MDWIGQIFWYYIDRSRFPETGWVGRSIMDDELDGSENATSVLAVDRIG